MARVVGARAGGMSGAREDGSAPPGLSRRRHIHRVAALVASSLAGVLQLGRAHAQAGPVEVAQDYGDGTAQNWLVYPDGRRVASGCRYSLATGECVDPAAMAPDVAPRPGVRAGKFSFITWWANNLNNKPFIDEAVLQWQARLPHVEIEVIGENVNQVRDKFTVAFAAGDPIDVAMVDFNWARDMYDDRLLLRLDQLIGTSPEVADDKFVPGAGDQFRRARGETFALPINAPSSLCLFVNSNHLEAAGLDPLGRHIRTWEDLAQTAQRLTQRNGDEVTRSGYFMSTLFDYLSYLATYMNTTGTPLYDAEQTRASFTSQSAAAAMEYLARLHNGLRVTVPLDKEGRGGSGPNILNGSVAIADWVSAGVTTTLRQAPPDLRYWQIPYPQGPGGSGPASHTWNNLIALASSSRNVDQGWEFVRWFAGSVALHIKRIEIFNGQSSLRAFYEQPAWQRRLQELPVLQTIQDIAELPGQVPFRRAAAQQQEINPLLREAILGRLDIRNALQQAQAIADRVLSR